LLAFHKQAAVFFGVFTLLEEFTALPPALLPGMVSTDELLSPDTTEVPLDSGETTEASDGLSSKQATRQSITTLVASLKILLNITPNLLHL
jgi:hypothetical protein